MSRGDVRTSSARSSPMTFGRSSSTRHLNPTRLQGRTNSQHGAAKRTGRKKAGGARWSSARRNKTTAAAAAALEHLTKEHQKEPEGNTHNKRQSIQTAGRINSPLLSGCLSRPRDRLDHIFHREHTKRCSLLPRQRLLHPGWWRQQGVLYPFCLHGNSRDKAERKQASFRVMQAPTRRCTLDSSSMLSGLYTASPYNKYLHARFQPVQSKVNAYAPSMHARKSGKSQ